MKSPSDYQLVQEIFDSAMELGKSRRGGFLDERCLGNAEVRAEVESLLAAAEEVGDFLDDPVIDGTEAFTTTVELHEGEVVDRYRLLEKIGEGSNAVVFMVEQLERIRRRAAMKVIKLGMDTREVIARFEVERQALALMDHPNIAKVFDAGSTDKGRPYFIMELVKGIPITDYCDHNNLSTRERLELFVQVCLALQHAHLKGIIHRDVKPSNILVTLHDGVPVPKVIDFGIAKATEARLTDRTLFTRFHQFIGTPAYMSPEQAEMSGLDIDTRSDIYSLGVLLYELMTGSTPFDGRELLDSGISEIHRIIREQEPERPSTRLSTLGAEGLTAVAKSRRIEAGGLGKDIKGDLDWIIMKALEKDRTRRYETVREFVRDIRRHLNDEPVEAGPKGRVYYLRKFVKRHRSMVFAGGVILLVLLTGVVASTYLWRQSSREAADARRQAEKAQSVTDLLERMFQSAGPDAGKGSDFTVRELLDDFVRDFGNELDLDPEVEMTVSETIGKAYEGLGDYVKAELYARRAHELSKDIFGETSEAAMRTLSQVGWLTFQHGSHEKGLAQMERAAAGQEATSDDARATHCYLANAYLEKGELDKAEALAGEVLEATKPADGEVPKPIYLWVSRTLAGVYQDQGRPHEAKAMLERSLEKTHLSNKDHPRTIEAMHTVCRIRLQLGELDAAETLAKTALESATRTLDSDHRTTLLLRSDLALIAEARGELDRADRDLRAILREQRRTLGDYNRDTIATILALAGLERKRGQFAEAIDLAKEAHANAAGSIGEGHSITIESLGLLGEAVAAKGRYFEAGEIFEKAYLLAREELGEERETTLRSARRLALFEKERGNLPRAGFLLKQIWQQREKSQGPDGEQTLDSLLEYIQFQREIGQYAVARELAADLHQRLENDPDEHFAILIETILEQAEIELASGVDFVSKQHLDTALDFALKHFEEDHLKTIAIMSRKAEVALILDRELEAEGILEKALPLARSQSEELAGRILLKLESARGEIALEKERADEATIDYRKSYLKHLASFDPNSRESFDERNRLIEILWRDPGRYEKCAKIAEDNYNESFDKFGENDIQTMRALHIKAQVEEAYGRDETAHEFYRETMARQREGGMLLHQRSLTTLYFWSNFLQRRGRFEEADGILDQWQDEIHKMDWSDSPSQVQLLLERRGPWRFRRFLKNQGDSWRVAAAADLGTEWHHGMAPIGYGISGIGTMPLIDGGKRAYFTTCFHREFEVADPKKIRALKIRLRREDGATVFLNGRKVVRDNLHETAIAGTSARANQAAITRNVYYSFLRNPKHLKEGKNVVAVELHQTTSSGEHMVFDLQIEALTK